jgi:hypothetical protein
LGDFCGQNLWAKCRWLVGECRWLVRMSLEILSELEPWTGFFVVGLEGGIGSGVSRLPRTPLRV